MSEMWVCFKVEGFKFICNVMRVGGVFYFFRF